MTTIGFAFTKIHGERSSTSSKGKIEVKNNISIKDVQEQIISGSDVANAIKISFTYESKYEPNIGSIQLAGDLIEMTTKDQISKIVEDYKKTKALPKDMLPKIMNAIFSRCQIQGIILSKDLSLPSPVPLRKIQVETKE